ncbi:unnamed protein product [Parnassius mnemosyne]|uniref:Uncharacterized protein n=1 Tax=Parnassius mnemosyne TaxID=213953 RepID=A0AAV1L2J9_9NEOP
MVYSIILLRPQLNIGLSHDHHLGRWIGNCNTVPAPAQRLQLYKAQVRPHMKYCSHLWAGAPQCQLLSLDRIQRRAVRIVDDSSLSDRLDSLALRRDVASLCIFFRIYHGKCSEELFGLIPAAKFHERISRQNSRYHPHHLDDWQFTTMFSSSHNFLVESITTSEFSGPIQLRDLKKKSLLLFKRPATKLQLPWFPWSCSCSWAAVVIYHQVSRMLVCPLSY